MSKIQVASSDGKMLGFVWKDLYASDMMISLSHISDSVLNIDDSEEHNTKFQGQEQENCQVLTTEI